MRRLLSCAVPGAVTAALLAVLLARPGARSAERPHGLAGRVPWTTSRVVGSPDPPHPYRLERVFPKLTFKNPLLITTCPGSNRLFVGEHVGKLWSFPDDPNVAKADLFLDPVADLHSWDPKRVKGVDTLYALAFHPRFQQNRYCYICYALYSTKDGEQLPDGSRVSRFRVTDTDPPRVDPKSEKVLITWMAGGHNGCDLHFGNDGYLYISTGDAANPNPPDSHDTGQDISDLLSSVLRIDVDHEEKGKPYAVPADNPFVNTPGARPEVWAYGFRNPWRMSFDRPTGDLWVGDVGWELWEMIYHVRKGGNYGWSVMEGPQPVRPDSRRGPTPILPPALAFPHTEAASITGGYVYRGKRLPELAGAYVCGDWVTRKVWGTRFGPDDKVTWHKELAQGDGRIVSFCPDRDGELYILNYEEAGTICRLVPNEAVKEYRPDFPRTLSATGLFTSVTEQTPAPGVLPFDVNAPLWSDHATAEHFLGLPGESPVRIYDSPIPIPGGFFSGTVFFPKHSVLARTVSLEMEAGNPHSRRRLETQLLQYDGTTWHGYSYRWNEEQTDATLVGAAGEDRVLMVRDVHAPGGKRRQTWHYPSRTECITCHNPWAGYALAFTPPQLNRDHDYGGVVDNQLRAMHHAGLITFLQSDESKASGQPMKPPGKLTDPYDAGADLNERARSYLHVNCSHCHQFGAGGTADLELRYQIPLEQTKTLGVRPVQGTFDLPGAEILAAADPYRSVLFYRVSKLGRGRMPHLGSDIVDDRGVRLLRDWIRQLPLHRPEQALLDKLRALDEPALTAQEHETWAEQLDNAARALARADHREVPTPEDRQKAEVQLKAQAAGRARGRAVERAEAIRGLLANPGGALMLADALADGRVPESVRPEVLKAASASLDAQVRDLFERFLPDEQRVKRLGTLIKPEQILGLKGDAARGRELFFKAAGLQCVSCHRIGGTGSTLGPDLSQIGKKYTKAQILESILEPSKTIDPQYVTYVVETEDGKLYTGLLGSKTDREIVLRMAGDKEERVPTAKVTSMAPQKTSLMPEQLLRDLTAEQAADLVEFLAGLR